MSERQRLETAVRALARDARRGLGPHPSPEELLDYHAGDVSAAERDRVQEHLSLCPACTRALLDLSAFPDVEPARETDRLSPAELAAEWRRFEETTGSVRRPRLRLGVPPLRIAYALAASLLVAVVGLSIWNGRLRQEIVKLSGPRADVQVADLTPLAASRERAAAERDVVTFPAGVDRVLLILNLAEVPSYADYRMEVASPAGREVWGRRGVRPGPDGSFTLEIGRSFFAERERYAIRVLGRSGSDWALVAEYELRVRRE